MKKRRRITTTSNGDEDSEGARRLEWYVPFCLVNPMEILPLRRASAQGSSLSRGGSYLHAYVSRRPAVSRG